MRGGPDSLERLHAELMGTLRRLPSTPATEVQRFGPAADEVERFVSLLRDQPVTVWERAEEYRHNLELNPTVHEELVSKHRSLLDLGKRTGRSAALRAAAEAALDALPTRIHAAWELATILAAWAVALSDLLPAAELKVFCRPFDALRPDASDVSRPLLDFAKPPAALATEPPRPEAAAPRPVEAPDRQASGLTFAEVGGLEDVKARLRNALGDVLANPQVAAKLRVRVGGILLYGPPGNGKSYLARATAGEFRLNQLMITGADLSEGSHGDVPQQLRRLFEQARQRLPCLLFLDDIDAIAPPEGESSIEGARRSVRAALIECIGRAVETPGLVVMAATDALGMVDEAVVREGLFDFKIQVHDPDPAARRKILEEQLKGRHQLTGDDMDALISRTEGRSAGYIASLVNRAAQHALHRALAAPGDAVILGEDVKAALEERVGVVGTRQEQRLTWDDLVLPDETTRRLVVLQSMVENPQGAAALGIRKMPRGAILFGPPRTGKTSIARVFAAQTSCSFFALSGTELTSKWLGETEKKIRSLFRAAREARPAIVSSMRSTPSRRLAARTAPAGAMTRR